MPYKLISGDYIVAIGKGNIGERIAEEEYAEILAVIRTKPQRTETTDYRLKTDLTWEAYEVEPQPDPEDEEVDDSEALSILLGGAV